MYTAQSIADFLLLLAHPEAEEATTNLKLQKLLYYAQGIHLAVFDEPLFGDEIHAWSYGPVVESVYQRFKSFGADPIRVDFHVPNDVLNLEIRHFLLNIFQYFGAYPAVKLMQFTHAETPWKSATPNAIIAKETLKMFFKTRRFDQLAFPSPEQRRRNAARLLRNDYENDPELTILTALDGADFDHETW